MTVHTETVPGARYWSMVIRRGYALRIVDSTGRANAATLLFNPHHPLERYNMADTLKAQHTAFLTDGPRAVLGHGARVAVRSSRTRCGWHDTDLRASATPADVRRQFGEASYQERRNDVPPQRARPLSDRARQVRPRQARPRRERELLQRGAPPTTTARSRMRRGQLQAGRVRRAARRDGHAGRAQHAASAEPGARSTRRGPVELTIRRAGPCATDDCCRLPARERARLREHRDLQLPARPARAIRDQPHERALDASTLDPTRRAPRGRAAGRRWLAELARGQTLRIVDLEGNQAVDTLFYDAARPDRSATAPSTRSARRATST